MVETANTFYQLPKYCACFTHICAISIPSNRKFIFLLFTILIIVASSGRATNEIENGITGSPTVECEKEYIKFKVPTKDVFKGKVYVKGEYTNVDCVHSYSHGSDIHPSPPHPDNIGLEVERLANVRQSPSSLSKPGKSDASEKVKSSSRASSNEKAQSTYSNSSSSGEMDEYEQEGKNKEEQAPGEIYPQPPPVIFTKERGRGSFTLGQPTDAEFEVADTYNRQEEEEKPSSKPKQYTPSTSKTNGKDKLSDSSKSRTSTSRAIPSSHLPGFSATDQTANWRNFLRGRPGLDGQSFRRYGSKVSPDANGECPLICPPCDDCRSKYADEDSEEGGTRRRRTTEHAAELNIRLGTCNTRRDRTANPPGVHISFTVIVSFHDSFITKVDRAYHIECAYEESDHTVTTQMDVSQPPTVQLSGTVQPPQCQYRIQAAGEGGVITNVRVGDTVQHEWQCTSAAQQAQYSQGEEGQTSVHNIFGLLIHDCYIDDGKGRKERVVDHKGCSTDSYILPTPSYSSTTLSASATSLVAKFPDRDLLGFQCSITVCMKELGHCEGVTPPKCDKDESHGYGNSVRRRRSQSNNKSKTYEKVNYNQGQDEFWHLHAQMLTVFDFDGALEEKPDFFSHVLAEKKQNSFPSTSITNNEPLQERLLPNSSTDFCVSITAFGILIASSTFLVTISTAAIFAILFCKNPFYKDK